MSKLIITKISDLKTEKARKDEKTPRQFYSLYARDKANMLTGAIQRNFFQDHSADGKTAFWGKDLDYTSAKTLVGQEQDGEIVRLEVEPYDINGRQATSFTCLVLKGENAATIAKRNGHPVSSAVIAAASTKEVVA